MHSPVARFRLAVVLVAMLLAAFAQASAQERKEIARVEESQAGATIQSVTIETYGVVKPELVQKYLSLKQGDELEQAGVNRDFDNLETLGDFIPRLQIDEGSEPHSVTLHWIVMFKWLSLTKHPFYSDAPLVAPIQGVGFIVTSPPVNKHGANISSYTQLSRRANLVRILYTEPVHINPVKGRESDFSVNVFGGRGVYRESMPEAINIYSWNTGAETTYLVHGTNGNQLELGARDTRSSTAQGTSIVAPSLYLTNEHPARNLLLEGAYSHGCLEPPTKWYPPYCKLQYRFQVGDSIGGLGSTSEYQSFIGSAARYFNVGTSTLALNAAVARTGGVVPDSFLVCTTGVRGFPKQFCGTDATTLQAEYRIADAVRGPLHFVLFTETAASRVRGSTSPFAPSTYTWHPDSGIALIFHGVRFDLAYGPDGGRFSFELQGQTF